MSHERDGLEAGIPGGKDCLRHDSSNPEHPKLSCDDPDERAGNRVAVKTRPRLQSKYNILLASLAGTDLLVGAATHPRFIAGQIYVIKGLSLIEYCQYHKEIYLIFGIPVLASLFHLTLISIERFVAIKCTFRYVTVVTGLRLKIAIVGSWIIACLPLILQSFYVDFQIVIRDAAALVTLLNVSLILYCHLSVYFVTRRHEKQIKCQQVSPQAAADFAREKKALKTTRMIIMALLVCFAPLFLHNFFLFAYVKSSSGNSYIVNVIVLSQPILVSFFLLNSLCNPIIYCYRNKTFRKTCEELIKLKRTNFNGE